jgi:hypothetical protein
MSRDSLATARRPILWFIAASIATTTVHEFAHATVAYALGVRSTLYSYSANLDLTPEQAASSIPVVVRVAGPTVCLLIGMLSWFALMRVRSQAARLPLLYFAVFGIGTFFGNLTSVAFIGDFSSIADTLALPMAIRYVVAGAGFVSLIAVHGWVGRQLLGLVPATVGRVAGTLAVIVVPTVIGTAAVIVVNQPMPPSFAGARAGETFFWLFAVISAIATKRVESGGPGSLALRWTDGLAAGLAVLAVRVMVRGIPLVP